MTPDSCHPYKLENKSKCSQSAQFAIKINSAEKLTPLSPEPRPDNSGCIRGGGGINLVLHVIVGRELEYASARAHSTTTPIRTRRPRQEQLLPRHPRPERRI